MNKEFFKANRAKFINSTEDNSVALLFSGTAPKKSADEAYHFTPNRNFYYMTGISDENVILMIEKYKGVATETIFIKKADKTLEKWVGKTISQEEAVEVSGCDNVVYLETFENKLHSVITKGVSNIYLDFERDRFSSEITYTQKFANDLRGKYPFVTLKDSYNMISEFRKIKSKEEVEEIKKAIEITWEGIKALMKNSKSGVREYELEAYFDFELKTRGVKDYAFKTIAASGKGATILHYVNNDAIIEKDSLVLYDLGAQLNYYNADISRTLPVDGKFTERQKTFYNLVLKAELEVIKMIKPGVPYKDLNEKVKEIYAKGLKELGLIKEDAEVFNYYYHGVGHFLGLDTHDVGSRDCVLEPGMVLTVEPGIYVEEESIGIRIEDDVLVTEDGCEVLSPQIIKTVEDIEAFMAK